VTATATLNSLSAWRTLLVANSETISTTESHITGARPAIASATKPRAWRIDADVLAKTRSTFTTHPSHACDAKYCSVIDSVRPPRSGYSGVTSDLL
jgi:hypothetical protein